MSEVSSRSNKSESAPNAGTDNSTKFIQGVSNRNGVLLILVDLNKLLNEDEWSEFDF